MTYISNILSSCLFEPSAILPLRRVGGCIAATRLWLENADGNVATRAERTQAAAKMMTRLE